MKRILVLAVLLGGCGLAASDSEKPKPKAGSISYQLSCQAPIVGEVKTWVTYTLRPSAEPVPSGDVLVYELSAPPARIESAVGTSFVRSKVTYPLPVGMSVERVSMRPPSTKDVKTATARVDGETIVVESEGDYPLDGSKRDLPLLVIEGTVTAEPGGTVELDTPLELVGTANAGIFGDQTSTCHVVDGGPIYTSTVE